MLVVVQGHQDIKNKKDKKKKKTTHQTLLTIGQVSISCRGSFVHLPSTSNCLGDGAWSRQMKQGQQKGDLQRYLLASSNVGKVRGQFIMELWDHVWMDPQEHKDKRPKMNKWHACIKRKQVSNQHNYFIMKRADPIAYSPYASLPYAAV